MEIVKGIEIVHEALWLKKSETLVIGDFHLGYEEYLHQTGVLVPKQQFEQVMIKLKEILQKIKIKPKIIVINGDLKHEFGRILKQEWTDVLKVIDFLSANCQELILVKGNHDSILGPIAEKRKIKVVDYFVLPEILIVHGHKLLNELSFDSKENLVNLELIKKSMIKTIIIGHEHPAVTLREKGKIEKYKCFLKGKFGVKDDQKDLIVLPSFNPLSEGTDVLREKLLSPFLENINNFEIFVINQDLVFNFGKIGKIGNEIKQE